MMGCTVSDPLPDHCDVGYVSIVMDEGNSCRLIHAPQNVIDAVASLIRFVLDDWFHSMHQYDKNITFTIFIGN